MVTVMGADDQAEVIRFLEAPSTHGEAAVERLDTHASVVVLAGARAWKLKRAVRYDYLDFSTPERRRAMCERELQTNRRTAPALYRGVVAITRQPDGRLALGGQGPAVDWVIEMTRFDGEGLFDRLAARGALALDLMAPLAASIATMHASAEPRPDHGGRAGMAWTVDGNAAAFAAEPRLFDAGEAQRLTRAAIAQLDRHGWRLDRRRDAGLVRQCHGDLHLRNIVLLDGVPTPFDAIEFNDDIACIDVIYDIAFLLMDLWRRRLPRHANAVLNAYLRHGTDLDGLALLPLFLSCRAAIRAKTSAAAAALASAGDRRQELGRTAGEYLTMAAALLRPPPPALVAVGGFSGSGKSTLARDLAPFVGAVPGAVTIRTDEIRKRICGVDPLTPLGADGYAPAVSRQVYAAAGEQAAQVIAAGHAAVVDGVFARSQDREAIERVATGAGVSFAGIWLDAPAATLCQRVGERRGDPSDADAGVIRAQLAAGAGDIAWPQLDASTGKPAVATAAQAQLLERGIGGALLTRENDVTAGGDEAPHGPA
jgi:aminoglycoside phosphotransferase family enzyme/predicted kinase